MTEQHSHDHHNHNHNHDEHDHDHDHIALSTIGELDNVNITNKPSFGYDRGGQQISREDRKWDGDAFGSSATVTYSWLSDSQADSGYRQLTTAQKNSSKAAMDMWSAAANIDFTPAGGGRNVSNLGDITFQGYDSGGGWASWWLRGGGATDQITSATVALGSSNFSLALHEVGHAIGLSHPGDYNGGGNSYARDAEFYQETEQYTVMSYWSGNNTGATLYGATGLGLYDIAAIQRLYGANNDTYTGNTVYGFNSNTQDAGWTLTGKSDWIQAAIWDAGGNDTIDMSGYSRGNDIDLRQEAFSSTGGQTYNLAIAKGVVIENAVGGTGNDNLQGNSASNKLIGGAGNDTLRGGNGNDRLYDGSGTDDVLGGSGNDYIRVGGGQDDYDGGSGRDYISYVDSAGGVTIDLGADTISRSWGADDTITNFESAAGSRSGNDVLYGTSEANTLRSYGGNDALHGRNGNDKLEGGSGNDWLWGGNGRDTLVGGSGRDYLNGGSGTDILYGGASADIFHFDRGGGTDRIKDFQNNIDTLEFDNFSFLGNASDALGYARAQGADVHFDFGSNGSIWVDDVTLVQLSNDIEIV